MSRYIKTDALEQHKFVSWTVPEFYVEKSLEQQAYQLGWNNAIEAIMENEPTADVVEVVRCKDCKHYKFGSDDMHYCFMNDSDHLWQDDDYCSYGEPKSESLRFYKKAKAYADGFQKALEDGMKEDSIGDMWSIDPREIEEDYIFKWEDVKGEDDKG